jgi:glycosyltransferase involved in cell wall biosynthesis
MKINVTATQGEAPCTGGCKVEIAPDVREAMENEAKRRFNIDSQAQVKRDNWPDQTTTVPRVTLAMIVRDEEAHIAECLASVKDYVDEIVVVDTGSTDKTVEICKSFGAKVYHHPWEDSFSKARNQAIQYVDTPWLLQLDADEVMPLESAKRIRDQVRAAHKTTSNLVHMTLINKEKGKEEIMSVISTGKIMRVLPTLYFTNRVHNRLHCPGDVIKSSLEIFHHGYSLPCKETMAKKKDRTTRLLKIQRKEQPDDPETAHYLAIQYLRMDDWEMAIQIGKDAVKLWEIHEPMSQLKLLSMYTIAMANYQLGSRCKTRGDQDVFFDEAIDFSERSLVEYPDYIDSNCMLASIYFAKKDHVKCLKYSEAYFCAAEMLKKDPSKALVIPLMTLKHEWTVCLQLAINYFEQADSETASFFIRKGEDLLPPESKYQLSWGVFKYMITLGDPISLKNAEAIYQVGFRLGK